MKTTHDLLAGSKPADVTVADVIVPFQTLRLSKKLSRQVQNQLHANEYKWRTVCQSLLPVSLSIQGTGLQAERVGDSLRAWDIFGSLKQLRGARMGRRESPGTRSLLCHAAISALACLLLISRPRNRLREFASFIRTTRLKICHSPFR